MKPFINCFTWLFYQANKVKPTTKWLSKSNISATSRDQRLSITPKTHQNCWRPGFRLDSRWGSSRRFPRPPSRVGRGQALPRVIVFNMSFVEMTSQLQDGGFWHCSKTFNDLGRQPTTFRSRRSGPGRQGLVVALRANRISSVRCPSLGGLL